MANNGAFDVSSSYHSMEEETAAEEGMVHAHGRLVPIASVTRIMKKVLPPDARISGDAKRAVQKCVTEYITFITGEANDRCRSEERRTVTAMEVIWSMSKLGFDEYVQPVMLYLRCYRELEGDHSPRQPVEYGSPEYISTTEDQMRDSGRLPHHPAAEYFRAMSHHEGELGCRLLFSARRK